MDKKRDPNALYCDESSLTKQSFVDECDINQIVDRARNGADVSHVNARVGQYGDFSNVPSYQEALDLVNRANGMFMSLDAFVRERFGNDPSKMVRFLQDPKNRDEAVKLGLVRAPEAPVNPPVGGDMPHIDDIGADSGASTETPSAPEGKAKKGGSK